MSRDCIFIYFQIALEVYHSALGNNQYVRMPYSIKTDLCAYFNGPYRKYAMPSLKPPECDMPYTEDENVNVCEIFKKNGGV